MWLASTGHVQLQKVVSFLPPLHRIDSVCIVNTAVKETFTVLGMIEMYVKGCRTQMNGMPFSNFIKAFYQTSERQLSCYLFAKCKATRAEEVKLLMGLGRRLQEVG